ncbi:MAG: hypothetical protein M5R42_12400 [Rhodocyclaceae bacterium]|nr:hypothetical protein [Rhodocyclaceae bacterium]
MIGLDTNVLLRYIVRDEAAQAKAAQPAHRGTLQQGGTRPRHACRPGLNWPGCWDAAMAMRRRKW